MLEPPLFIRIKRARSDYASYLSYGLMYDMFNVPHYHLGKDYQSVYNKMTADKTGKYGTTIASNFSFYDMMIKFPHEIVSSVRIFTVDNADKDGNVEGEWVNLNCWIEVECPNFPNLSVSLNLHMSQKTEWLKNNPTVQPVALFSDYSTYEELYMKVYTKFLYSVMSEDMADQYIKNFRKAVRDEDVEYRYVNFRKAM